MSELKGKVIWFDSKLGIGFLAAEDGSKDVFVHYSNIQMEGFKSLEKDQVVTYELGQNHKGVQAVQVKVVK